ncbi:hypothetical protein Q5424_20490 [Conexibacter sp. JD483]|uniref:hypothetical protein n=1 Tax=unclassified Conexibacter TaxID=2627773 RepID=UPI002720AE9E|nr:MULTISPECIES: hypothetical protein [unclassified Conexibacter]MDO8186996.1 hypothetical protein [Conexibacter sp. CPCC 205706]MDO8200686.1 hypothetical protein [Conexibacter sp. CPCC 205762]MDR9371489.1 hypothetical protein [Conexibacter sp. JD483]
MPLRSRILIALAALLTVIALLGAWADRQLMNTDEWTATSSALLRDDVVRQPVADAIASSVADGSRATAALQDVLPPRLQPLAPQAGALVREAAQRATERLLDTPKVQRLWVDANRVTHQQFVDLVNGGGTVIAGRGVVLDLRPLAIQVAKQAGFSGDRIERLPPSDRIVLIRPDQLDALRKAGDLLDLVSWLPGVLALLLFAGAVWQAGPARRRAVLASGGALLGAGLLVLVVRRLAGHTLVDAVAGDGPYVPTAQAVWRIGTSLLAELASVAVIVGLFALLGAWLVGPGRRATSLRGLMTPGLSAPLGAVLGGAAVVYLALLAWGPLTVLRRPLPIVVFGVLLVVGVWLLRAQALREQAASAPDVARADAPA